MNNLAIQKVLIYFSKCILVRVSLFFEYLILSSCNNEKCCTKATGRSVKKGAVGFLGNRKRHF